MGKIYTALISLLVMSLPSCTYFRQICRHDKPLSDAWQNLPVIYNDSINHIISGPDKVYLYETYDFIEAHDTTAACDSIFNYKIKNSGRRLNDKECELLEFIITDPSWITARYTPVRQSFYPNIILEFSKSHQKAYLLLSFGSEEVGACGMSGDMKRYRMIGMRNLARWASIILPEEEYYKKLLTPEE